MKTVHYVDSSNVQGKNWVNVFCAQS